ncbi:hypothetical protein [Micromonospora sp. IBHARD004]
MSKRPVTRRLPLFAAAVLAACFLPWLAVPHPAGGYRHSACC